MFDIYNLYALIEMMKTDIMHLEEALVQTRFELSNYLACQDKECLQSELFSNLAGRYDENPVYSAFINCAHDSNDPMESAECTKQLMRIAHIDID